VMERHGFLHYPGEFWHYNKGDSLYQIQARTGKPRAVRTGGLGSPPPPRDPYADPLAR